MRYASLPSRCGGGGAGGRVREGVPGGSGSRGTYGPRYSAQGRGNRIRSSNGDVGGKIFEAATVEYYVRGRGYIKSLKDIEDIVLKVENGTPVYVRNVGKVHLGSDLRRGVAELDGKGETVGGIIVMRYGENALRVIDGVKKKLAQVQASLPPGVRVVPVYDRSDLILRAVGDAA